MLPEDHKQLHGIRKEEMEAPNLEGHVIECDNYRTFPFFNFLSFLIIFSLIIGTIVYLDNRFNPTNSIIGASIKNTEFADEFNQIFDDWDLFSEQAIFLRDIGCTPENKMKILREGCRFKDGSLVGVNIIREGSKVKIEFYKV